MSQLTDSREAAAGRNDGGDPPTPFRAPSSPKRRRRRRRALIIVTVIAVAVLAIPAAGALYLGHKLDNQIGHIPGVFDNLRNRPTKPTTGAAAKAVNILLLGTDRRSEVPTTGSSAKASAWVPGEQRSDTMMVLHIDADRKGASTISIPRDSWVTVPGYGKAKANAAYSWGGPSLAVKTVERLTNVRIDHLAVVDWDGYKAMINALGGIEVTVPRTVYDSARRYTWTAGAHHLTGAQALLYARERHGLPGGDLDRVKRQQAVLRALSKRALEATGSPTTMYHLLNSLTQNLDVDDGWSTADLARLGFSLRHLSVSDVNYLTIPVSGTGMEGSQSVVYVDPPASRQLWRAVRTDAMTRWATAHPGSPTGRDVN